MSDECRRLSRTHKKYMAQRREREKTHIEKTSAGKFHSSGCVDTQHTDCILWLGILIRRSFIAKKAEWYKETTTQSERKREKKSIENVFIHLCQVNEHGICTMFPSLCIIQWNTHTTVASLPLYRCAFFVCVFCCSIAFAWFSLFFLFEKWCIVQCHCLFDHNFP